MDKNVQRGPHIPAETCQTGTTNGAAKPGDTSKHLEIRKYDGSCCMTLLGHVLSLQKMFETKDKGSECEAFGKELLAASVEDFRSTIGWATSPRSREQMLAVFEQTCACTPDVIESAPTAEDMFRDVRHRVGVAHTSLVASRSDPMLQSGSFAEPIHKPGIQLVRQHLDLMRLVMKKYFTENPMFQPRHVLSSIDWLPHGLEGTYHALVGWLTHIPSREGRHSAFGCLISLLDGCHVVLVPRIILWNSKPLILAIVASVRHTCATWVKDLKFSRSSISAYEDTVRGLYRPAQFAECLLITVYDPHFRRLIASCGRNLLLCCVEARGLAIQLSDISLQYDGRTVADTKYCTDFAEMYAICAGKIVDIFPNLLEQCPIDLSARLNIIQHRIGHLPRPRTSYWRLYRIIYLSLQYPICQRIGCYEAKSATARHIRVCDGCHIVRYCSRHCQKLAWADPQMAHKDICATLGALRQRLLLGGSLNAKRVDREWSNKRIPSDSVLRYYADAVDWVVERLHGQIELEMELHHR